MEVGKDRREDSLEFGQKFTHDASDFPVSRAGGAHKEDVPPLPPVGGNDNFRFQTDRENLAGVLRQPAGFPQAAVKHFDLGEHLAGGQFPAVFQENGLFLVAVGRDDAPKTEPVKAGFGVTPLGVVDVPGRLLRKAGQSVTDQLVGKTAGAVEELNRQRGVLNHTLVAAGQEHRNELFGRFSRDWLDLRLVAGSPGAFDARELFFKFRFGGQDAVCPGVFENSHFFSFSLGVFFYYSAVSDLLIVKNHFRGRVLVFGIINYARQNSFRHDGRIGRRAG